VLPARFGEGCPNALLEAMAAGKPVVAARTGGIPEVVVDGKTGILVPREDVDALQAALRRLAADPALRASMGAAGRERAKSEFSAARLVESYQGLYSELTASL
jgi:glycosyltransferase involved in cell wall biosynthesis